MIESMNLKNFWKSYDSMSVWCDELRLSYFWESEFIEDRLSLLDCDNSNFGTITIDDIVFTFQKVPCSIGMSLIFSVSYNDVPVPVFDFVKFNEQTKFMCNRYWKLEFYGSFFQLWVLWFFSDIDLWISMICFYISWENPKVTRYDYRIDFFNRLNYIPVADWRKVLDIKTQTKVDPKYTWDELTNWLVWKKDTGTYCVRLYNKLIDTDFKDKIFLYQDYFNYKTVHRLEFEFQRNFLKWFTLEDYLDRTIQKKVESLLHINEKLWSWFVCYVYDSSREITDKNRSRYIRRFNNMSVKLAKNNINPLVQSYEILYESLEREELEKIVNDFFKVYIWNAKKYLVDKMSI